MPCRGARRLRHHQASVSIGLLRMAYISVPKYGSSALSTEFGPTSSAWCMVVRIWATSSCERKHELKPREVRPNWLSGCLMGWLLCCSQRGAHRSPAHPVIHTMTMPFISGVLLSLVDLYLRAYHTPCCVHITTVHPLGHQICCIGDRSYYAHDYHYTVSPSAQILTYQESSFKVQDSRAYGGPNRSLVPYTGDSFASETELSSSVA